MSLNDTPRSDRIHIGLFGRRNAGKSSLLNAITGQNLSIVSPVEGTTTDPVYKSMELLPLGPVVMIDTPGFDDCGMLGQQRVKKARQAMNKTDLALLVVDGPGGLSEDDRIIRSLLQKKQIPFLTVMTKCDLLDQLPAASDDNTIWVSTATGYHIHELKERLALLKPEDEPRPLVRDLVAPHDFVILVVPIDKAAPKGRLILPQQQTIRELLDCGAVSIVVRDHELKHTLQRIGTRPRLVITDSQAFARVSAETPPEIALTSFSILFARSKGSLATAVAGVSALKQIQDGDQILIAEGCTHHRQCDDIGTVKLPHWINRYTGKQPEYVFTSGTEYPEDLSPYRLIIHCGGCMLNGREMKFRNAQARDQGVPITNYGIVIAQTQGILRRSLLIFPDLAALLD